MDGNTAATVAEGLVLGVLAGVSAWKAWRAERQTRGTGNGFAATVKDALGRIEAKVDHVDGKVDQVEQKIDGHIAAHANAHVGGAR